MGDSLQSRRTAMKVLRKLNVSKMIRLCRKCFSKSSKTPVLLGFSIFGVEITPPNFDKIDPETKTVKEMNKIYDAQQEHETGWDRVKAALSKDDFENLSPELEAAVQAGYTGLFVGAFLGAVSSSREAYTSFIANNKATVFESHFEASKALQHKVTLAMANGGFKVGWRLGLFSSGFVLFTSLIAAYRNKTSVLEYSAGGAIAGALYKTYMGPKAMFAGSLAGLGLGTVAGAISVGIMKLTGTTAEELRFYRRDWKNAKTSEIHLIEGGKPSESPAVDSKETKQSAESR